MEDEGTEERIKRRREKERLRGLKEEKRGR